MGDENDDQNASLQEPLLNSAEFSAVAGTDDEEQRWIVDDSLVPQDTSIFSGESVPEHIVDGLPFESSLLIKSLYFLDAL